MKEMVPRCQKRIQESCKDVLDNVGCAEAWNFCWGAFTGLFSSKYSPTVEGVYAYVTCSLEINSHDALRPW